MTPLIYAGLPKYSQIQYRGCMHGDMSDMIIEEVSNYFEIDKSLLMLPTRVREIGFPRMVCIYLMKQKTQLTWKQISAKFNRDHSTAINAYKTVGNLIDTDKIVKAGVAKIEKRLYSE